MKAKAALILVALLAGCSLAPRYETPQTDFPARFKEAAELPESERGMWKEATPAEHLPRGEWWRIFSDQTLDALQARARAANPVLQVAAARLEQARAIVGVARADQLPQAGASFGPSRQRPSAAALGAPDGTDTSPRTVWRAEAFASYEIDLFGRIGDGVRAARHEAESAEAIYRSVLLALQADVAARYWELRAIDAELALLRDTVRLREQNVELTRQRYDAGVTSELDVARATTELETTRGEAIALERRRGEVEHALAVLVGEAPAAFSIAPRPLPQRVPRIPAGLPSQLLERRPDVAAAERALAAANARIGVARAAFFPVLQLTASGGYESGSLSDLFRWSSRTWLLGPLAGTILNTPIFTGGRLSADLDRAWAEYDEAVGRYRQTVLAAFAEVEDALIGLRLLGAQARANADALEAARRATEIAEARYRAGAANYLEVIDAQRSELAIRRLAVQIEGERHTATVALVRALGGGWQTATPLAAND